MASGFGNKKSGEAGSNRKTRRTKNAKRTWLSIAIALVRGLFRLFRQLCSVLAEIIKQVLHSGVYIVAEFLRIITEPQTICVCAIVGAGVVFALTSLQWYQLGLWLASLLRFPNGFLTSAGVVGAVAGLFLNIFQLSSELWKIRVDLAKDYASRNVDPHFEPEGEDEGIVARLQNWANHNHKTLRAFRRYSYVFETATMIAFVLLNSLDFMGLLTGAAALLLPEQSVKLVSATVGLLGSATEAENDQEEANNYGF